MTDQSEAIVPTVSHRLMGKKRGMIQLFDKSGAIVPCTVIHVEPNVITQLKTENVDGYNALKLGYDEIKVNDARTISSRSSKPLRGHYQKAGVQPHKHLHEVRVDSTEGFAVGAKLSLELFKDVGLVDVIGISKGKGYQGVMKLHNFSGGPKSHGSGFHRHAGSTGMRTSPGRCLPGGKRASHMGDNRVTVQNLKVVSVDIDNNLIMVEGAVPGTRNGLVFISTAKKKRNKKHK